MYAKDRSQQVLERCDNLARNGAWPKTEILNPRRWLKNFKDDEVDFALDILEGFIVLPNEQLVAHLRDSFMSLSKQFTEPAADSRMASSNWMKFTNELIVTPVTKEIPHPTQSGYTYARLVRQNLSIDKANIVELEQAIKLLVTKNGGSLLLVDDLVASGDQCIANCNRKINIPNIGSFSIYDLAIRPQPTKVFYRPIFATTYGLNRIRAQFPWIDIEPIHQLDERFSAHSPSATIWQDGRSATANKFVEESSQRAGVDPTSIWGFHGLGLILAFEYGPPDASLGIIMHKTPDWNPLIERT